MWNIVLIIEGKQKTLKKFKKIAKSHDGKRILDFNQFIPYPNEHNEWFNEYLNCGCLISPSPSGFNEKWEWRHKNWGTCSNADSYYIEEDEELSYYFSVGNGIAYPVIIEISERFPTLEFTIYYCDEFGECSGVYVIENGIELLDEFDEHFDLIEAELECQTEEDLRKYYEMELRGEFK